jgi:hypothetical protein
VAAWERIEVSVWERIEVSVWERILFRVNLTISIAMSASRIRDSEAVRFERLAETSATISSSDWISAWALTVASALAEARTPAARLVR